MIIAMNNDLYNLAKSVDFSDLKKAIKFDDEKTSIELKDEKITMRDFFDNEYQEWPIWIMLACISDEVERSGLSDDQEKVLPRGRALYELYDAIYYSLPVREEE